jgi:hypothetical protein
VFTAPPFSAFSSPFSPATTSPDCLAEELLSHKGAGTLIRKGARITTFDSLEGIDVPRLVDLIQVRT